MNNKDYSQTFSDFMSGLKETDILNDNLLLVNENKLKNQHIDNDILKSSINDLIITPPFAKSDQNSLVDGFGHHQEQKSFEDLASQIKEASNSILKIDERKISTESKSKPEPIISSNDLGINKNNDSKDKHHREPKTFKSIFSKIFSKTKSLDNLNSHGNATNKQVNSLEELPSDQKSKRLEIANNVEDENNREKWDRKTEFLLAIIGFSVDLGNVWRFPKVVYDNGGGRFMIPYFIQLILCGLPLFYMELVLGQYHQTGVFTLWDKICPILKGLAFASVVINLLLSMFYNTIIAWAAYYLYLSISTVVPWHGCDNKWNTDCCFPINQLNDIYKNNSVNTEGSFQNLSSTIYRNFTNKLILFNNNNLIPSIDDVKTILNLTDLYVTIDTNISTNATELLIDWLNSYYILVNNTNLVKLKSAYFDDYTINSVKFDSSIAIQSIENEIKNQFMNETYSIVLNCSKFTTSPTQEFYSRYLTEMHRSRGLDDIGSIKWEITLCLFLVFLTVYFALWKGIKSAGKAVWITAIAPYVVMTILLIRGLTLPGCWNGIKFYLGVESWSAIFQLNVWIDAAAQIFFSLGPGFGTIIALSSYNKKSNNCYKDALLTSFINCLTSILSGFVVFTTLGHMAEVQGKNVTNVIEGGPGLVFITYPQAISLMPLAPFWAIIFFFMLFTLGIDSTFGGLESVITGICDSFPNTIGKRRAWFVLGLVTFCFVAALPTVTYGGPYVVNLLDNFAVTPALMFIAFLETIGVMYCYGYNRFCDDIYEMLKFRPGIFWKICWLVISPSIVLAMIIMTCRVIFKDPIVYDKYVYVGLGQYLSYIIVAVPLLIILLYAPYKLFVTPGPFFERVKMLTIEPYRLNNKRSIEQIQSNINDTSTHSKSHIKINNAILTKNNTTNV